MLYFHSLQQGLSYLPPADQPVRQRLQREAEALGWSGLHQRLARIDPPSAQRIHPHDSQRIQRALEVYEVSGCTMTAWYAQALAQPQWQQPWLKLVLCPTQRSVLHAKIAQRLETMLAQGLIAEVDKLFNRGDLTADLPAMRCVGYRQVWHYLLGQLNYDNLIAKTLSATRQMAKRQLTWLRTQADAIWFDSQQPRLTNHILNEIEKNLIFSKPVK
jgi:tRNA dimethylallyltransferase